MAASKKYNSRNDAKCLIQHMAKGKSFRSYAFARSALIKNAAPVSRSTLYEWVKTYKAFREAKEIGHAAALYYYENLLSLGLLGQTEILDKESKEKKSVEINDKLLRFVLGTRFYDDYGQKSQIDINTGSTPLDTDTVDAEKLGALLALIDHEKKARGIADDNLDDLVSQLVGKK